jgi:hypothetical protein
LLPFGSRISLVIHWLALRTDGPYRTRANWSRDLCPFSPRDGPPERPAAGVQIEIEGANVGHSNPPGMVQPTAYSQVVEVNGPHRLVFVAGQTGVDARAFHRFIES